MRKLLIALVLVVLGAGAVVGGLAIWVHNAMGTPHQHAKAGQWISIERGTAPAAVIGKLVSEGIIADGTHEDLLRTCTLYESLYRAKTAVARAA